MRYYERYFENQQPHYERYFKNSDLKYGITIVEKKITIPIPIVKIKNHSRFQSRQVHDVSSASEPPDLSSCYDIHAITFGDYPNPTDHHRLSVL
ncbi:hypothetical protein VPH159E362A_0062 [Vibrio phage 159E36-2a]